MHLRNCARRYFHIFWVTLQTPRLFFSKIPFPGVITLSRMAQNVHRFLCKQVFTVLCLIQGLIQTVHFKDWTCHTYIKKKVSSSFVYAH